MALRWIESEPGRIVSIEGFEEANNEKWVEADSFVSVGDTVGMPISDGDRLGYILAYGNSRKETKKRIENGLNHIRVSLRSGGRVINRMYK